MKTVVLLLSFGMCACGANNTGGDHPVQVIDDTRTGNAFEVEIEIGGQGGDIITFTATQHNAGTRFGDGKSRYAIDVDPEAVEGVTAKGVAYLVIVQGMEGFETRNRVMPGWDVTVENGKITMGRRQN